MKIFLKGFLICVTVAIIPFLVWAQSDSLVSNLLEKTSYGLFRGTTPKNESCAVNIEKQSRFWNSKPAISVLVMTEKALNSSGQINNMQAVARFVFAENHPFFKVNSVKQTEAHFELDVTKDPSSKRDLESNMQIQINKLDAGTEIKVQESTTNFFKKNKSVTCLI